MVKANNPLHNISINTAIKIFRILRTKLPDAKSRLGLVCLGLVGFKLSIVKLFFWCNCVTPKLYRLGQVQYAPLLVRLGLLGYLCRLDYACMGMHLTYSVWGRGKFTVWFSFKYLHLVKQSPQSENTKKLQNLTQNPSVIHIPFTSSIATLSSTGKFSHCS